MTIIDIVSVAIGVAGLVFGAGCYWELWKWAQQCKGARIAIAYKRRVQLQAPLVEWLMWCNQLDKDKDSHGRVVWRQGYASVAISKRVTPRRHLLHRTPKPGLRHGTFQTKDDTPKAA